MGCTASCFSSNASSTPSHHLLSHSSPPTVAFVVQSVSPSVSANSGTPGWGRFARGLLPGRTPSRRAFTPSAAGCAKENAYGQGPAEIDVQEPLAEDERGISTTQLGILLNNSVTFRWRTAELIGRGATGTVHLGLDIDSGALLAIKTIFFRSTDRSLILSLTREMDIMRFVALSSGPSVL
jgi:hypothetical protein